MTRQTSRIPFLFNKVLIAFCVCGLSFASGQTDFRTFISPDGVFQFNYSRVLVRCTLEVGGEEGYPGSWVPSEDCNSQAGLCNDVASAANTIICLAYPKDTFKEKPKFSGAALFLAEIGAASTSQACLEGSKNWLIEGTKSVRVGSVKAKHFRTSDAWTSGGQTGDIPCFSWQEVLRARDTASRHECRSIQSRNHKGVHQARSGHGVHLPKESSRFLSLPQIAMHPG
jgi:hypothetical protein